MTYLCSLVSCLSQLSVCGYQWCGHNISCKWLQALVHIQVRKWIITHSLPSVKADNCFWRKTPSIFNPNHSLKDIFSTDYKGRSALYSPWNLKFKTFWFKNVKLWMAKSSLFVHKETSLSQCWVSYSSSFTILSICSNHINSDLLIDINYIIHLITWLACSSIIKNASFHNLKVLCSFYILLTYVHNLYYVYMKI